MKITKTQIIFILLLVIYTIYKNYIENLNDKKILSNPKYTNVFVLKKWHEKFGINFMYTYIISGEKYTISKDCGFCPDKLIGKSFPALYLEENPKEVRVLMFPKDFEEFGLNYPDSLNWVKRYIPPFQ